LLIFKFSTSPKLGLEFEVVLRLREVDENVVDLVTFTEELITRYKPLARNGKGALGIANDVDGQGGSTSR
jgi:hypothetical protein